MLTRKTTVVAVVLTGVLLELVLGVLSGRREAWDSAQYWTIGLPLAIVAAAAIGFYSRGTDWLWTALIVPGQVLTMMVKSGEIGGLWPLTVMFSAILSAPFVLVAFVASRFRRE